jgi:RarD protein
VWYNNKAMLIKAAKAKYISSMLVFGSVGVFVRYIPLPAAQIALGRGVVGCGVLLGLMLLLRQKVARERVRADLWLLVFSGLAIGVNWIMLFQAYRYTSIANATICYYMAPVLVMFLSPFVLKERLTTLKAAGILAAALGVALISGFGKPEPNDLAGILWGLGAAVFYAAVIILNKFFRQVSDFERTVIQLAFASLSLLPYVLLTAGGQAAAITQTGVMLLLVLGVVHTGLAYYLYFSGLHALRGQAAALLSYIDPLTAIVLAALIFGERMDIWQTVGGALILGSTMFAEGENT